MISAASVVSFFHEHGSPGQALFLVLCFCVFIRYAVSLGGYSGAGTPPMFGDYEAQRHWMEVTVALPLSDWYRQTADNDLQYWGLDYPPLSAYVSWVCGKAFELWEPAAVALHSSRGYETASSKLFMRLSVLFFDVIVYVPAIVIFFRRVQPHFESLDFSSPSSSSASKRVRLAAARGARSSRSTLLTLVVLLQPALILVDHGHFQYNCVSLGLALWAVLALHERCFMFGSILFCLSLSFKTMSLYLAPAFFFYLLSGALHCDRPLHRLVRLGAAVIGTFGLHFLPFCLWAADDTTTAGCAIGVGHVISRMFPFGRGLFEDKVANLWCSLSLVVKVQHLYETPTLLKMSTALTLLLLLPSGIALLYTTAPSTKALVVALLNSSLAFFLASFQVHEKSLLLSLLPCALLLTCSPRFFGWFSALGAFSMFPLLQKDGLTLQYFVVQTLFASVLLVGSGNSTGGSDAAWEHPLSGRRFPPWLLRWYLRLSVLGAVVIHCVAATVTPPARFPDIVTMLFAVYTCVHLCILWLYCTIWQWQIATDDNNSASKQKDHVKAQ